jgi:tetratricopeptide (TPR) repeat protein
MNRRLIVGVAVVTIVGAAAAAEWRAARATVAPAASALTENTQRFWQAYRAATHARSAARYDEAIAEYSRALVIRPGHEDSLYYLGNCYLERREYARALAAYQRLIALNREGSSRAFMQVALVHASLDPAAPVDLPLAQQFFERALALDPDSGALLGLAEVQLLRQKWQAAHDTLLRVDADNTMSIAAPYLLGFLAYREGNRQEAWRWFAMAVDRGELKKSAIKWTEEGDVKADPALRWRALARQSVFGTQWMRLRRLVPPAVPSPSDMADEYRLFTRELAGANTRAQKS